MSLSESITQEARALGFDGVGIARVDAPANPLQHRPFARLTQWLTRGFQGAMAWMERTPEKRADPGLVLPGCRSIVSVGINYLTDHRPDERPGHGRIARYAWGRDYHKVLSDRLKQLEQLVHTLAPDAKTLVYVDT